ncbi:mechanosensitive ion channel [Variovorax sp. J22R133]|uniref:mechanosensitive ion channel family protein n=1 Tax=Variovorax brevis TaxID=3053503 RepID=UPI002577D717|nr:mechanosensitive ion channel domain-containing protein [Variovorax sp. J22R133]MDM0113028.1 mechanosensitive ion channel [Variovorax sp. J22R133]
MQDFFSRLNQVHAQSLWIEAAALAGCIVVAWGICHWVGRGQRKDSIWFGARVFDGLLFPLLALLFSDLARRALQQVQTVLVLEAAVSVFLALVVVRLVARVLAAVFPKSELVRLTERAVTWFAWVGAVLWTVGLLPWLLEQLDQITLAFGKTHVSLRTILDGVFSAGLVLMIALWISSTVEKRLLDEAIHDLSMRKVASNAVRAVLLLVGLLFALSSVGVDLTALSVLGGALGVGLGFGLQKLAANYISGFVILLERSIRIGDNVKVDTFEGRITDIKTRYTLIRAGNGREAIVPNESLITNRVENLSIADRKFGITTNIVVGYDSSVSKVQEIMCDAATAQSRVMSDPAPAAYLLNFTPDGLEFSLNFWVSDPDKGQVNLRSDINITILEALRAAGISISNPQRVLRIESLPKSLSKTMDADL